MAMFKPKRFEFTITEDDESHVFYMQRRSLDDTLSFSEDATKNKDAKKMQRRLFRTFLVEENGEPLTDGKIEEMMAGDSVVISRISDFILTKLNLKKETEQEKNG